MFKTTILFTACLVTLQSLLFAQADLESKAIADMKRATEFYRTKVASHGGYVYHYALDLKQRWGEGEATIDQIWVQPPGTPTVGLAYIEAYRATKDKYYLSAVQEVADALIYGQLKSGGWANCIDFNPKGQRVAQYRNGHGGGKNNSSLDDGQTQTAIRFMVQADELFEFKNTAIHDSAQAALTALLAAQFESGGFPQSWVGPVEKHTAVKANYPKHDWRTEGRIKNYWELPTLNDDVCVFVAHTLMDAHRVYQAPNYLSALRKLGDFLILAQMPEPQPAWAQQYNHEMQPVWARRFEPAAISGHESQKVIELLMELAVYTGDEKYLEPVPQAIAYLRKCTLPDGQIARYYELESNRPLYMQRDGDVYSLTYSDANLPSHYSWNSQSRVDKLQRRFDELNEQRSQLSRFVWNKPTKLSSLAQDAKQILSDLDDQGRWITKASGQRLVGQAKIGDGDKYISSAAFSQNLTTLSRFVAQNP